MTPWVIVLLLITTSSHAAFPTPAAVPLYELQVSPKAAMQAQIQALRRELQVLIRDMKASVREMGTRALDRYLQDDLAKVRLMRELGLLNDVCPLL
jgi:hypothetical protein